MPTGCGDGVVGTGKAGFPFGGHCDANLSTFRRARTYILHAMGILVSTRVCLGAVVCVAALVVSGCGGGDNPAQDFGKISIPGHQTLILEAGEYGVYYQEDGYPEKYKSLHVPFGLDVEAKGIGIAAPAVFQRVYAANHVGGDGVTGREIGTLTVPARGRYLLTVGANEDATERASHHPAISVGQTFATQDKSFMRNFLIGAVILILVSLCGRKLLKGFVSRRTT
jgi:hypothetical protein